MLNLIRDALMAPVQQNEQQCISDDLCVSHPSGSTLITQTVTALLKVILLYIHILYIHAQKILVSLSVLCFYYYSCLFHKGFLLVLYFTLNMI